jgi:peroxiredoxin
MRELVQLQGHHEEFAKRKVRLVAISDDDQKTAQKTQSDFPNLVVVSDPDQVIAKAMAVIHPGAAGPDGGDTNAPTTFFVDGEGYVRRLFRPESILRRLSPAEVLTAIDETWRP